MQCDLLSKVQQQREQRKGTIEVIVLSIKHEWKFTKGILSPRRCKNIFLKNILVEIQLMQHVHVFNRFASVDVYTRQTLPDRLTVDVSHEIWCSCVWIG